MEILKDASQRRFIMGLLTILTPWLNRKLALNLSPDEVNLMVEAGLGYLLLSNGKEAIVERSKAAGQKAADAVVPGPETDAKFKELAKGPPAVLIALLAIGALLAPTVAFAADPVADAPVVEAPKSDLLCLDAVERTNIVKEDARKAARIVELEKNVGIPASIVIPAGITLVVISIAGGIALGYAIKDGFPPK